jgi:hypothetical protein
MRRLQIREFQQHSERLKTGEVCKTLENALSNHEDNGLSNVVDTVDADLEFHNRIPYHPLESRTFDIQIGVFCHRTKTQIDSSNHLFLQNI